MVKEYLDKNGLMYLWGKLKNKFADKEYVDQDYRKIISMGEQLIVNGGPMLGNNTNFSAWTYDGSMANGSGGSFTLPAGTASQPQTDYFFPIITALDYRLDFDLISKLNTGRMYSFFNFYDVDKIAITASDHMYLANTTTTLSQDLKNGDTVVHFEDLTNWNNTTSYRYQRGFIFWNYKNSFGYTYPENTYSRNHWENLYENSAVDKTAKTITLSAGWTHGTIPAGTKVSQGSSGSTYKYIATSYTLVPTVWTHYTGVMSGTDYSGQNISSKFPPGTAYARIGFLWNYQGTGNNEQFWLANLSVKEIPEKALNATNASKVNNHTVNSDVPANAVFTDTVTTATTSGSGNAVTAISASNGALTVTKGTTFLTQHQDISGKANVTAVAASASISNTDLITYKNSSGTALFTLQLPSYMLKTDMVAATDSEIDTILAS